MEYLPELKPGDLISLQPIATGGRQLTSAVGAFRPTYASIFVLPLQSQPKVRKLCQIWGTRRNFCHLIFVERLNLCEIILSATLLRRPADTLNNRLFFQRKAG